MFAYKLEPASPKRSYIKMLQLLKSIITVFPKLWSLYCRAYCLGGVCFSREVMWLCSTGTIIIMLRVSPALSPALNQPCSSSACASEPPPGWPSSRRPRLPRCCYWSLCVRRTLLGKLETSQQWKHISWGMMTTYTHTHTQQSVL